MHNCMSIRNLNSEVNEDEACIDYSQNDGKVMNLLFSNQNCLSVLEPITPCPISKGPPKLVKCGTIEGSIL